MDKTYILEQNETFLESFKKLQDADEIIGDKLNNISEIIKAVMIDNVIDDTMDRIRFNPPKNGTILNCEVIEIIDQKHISLKWLDYNKDQFFKIYLHYGGKTKRLKKNDKVKVKVLTNRLTNNGSIIIKVVIN